MTQTYDLSSSDNESHTTKGSGRNSQDEFVLVVGHDGLPIRTKQAPPEYPLSLELHPIQGEDALLVSVHPPRQPERQIAHVPCDIVLVIDVSGSMSDPAPLPDNQGATEQEFSGLSILDLTKHAARTILETLNDGDRLSIVTFSQDAKIIQPLTHMNEDAKKATNQKIEMLEDLGCTNLWAGIKTGLQVIELASDIGNVQGIYVLTDGQPNHLCPPQGYVNKLAPMLREMTQGRHNIPTIHTFGFGYTIRSNLLQSIAEVGNGNYAFIPEAGMIGTVFVHAVANLYSTYATSASLKLTCPRGGRIESRSGIISESPQPTEVTLSLGNIQYGQSRDNILHLQLPQMKSQVTATLTYKLPSGDTKSVSTSINKYENTGLPQVVKDYHMHRDRLCRFLASLFPLASNGEHVLCPSYTHSWTKGVDNLYELIKSSADPRDANIISLLSDLKQSSPESQDGQISHALTQKGEKTYWNKWGRHYLPSLLHAHLRQQCNSFKDPGPMRYGVNSPLFIRCRDQLDKAFDNLPAPKPSLTGENLQRYMYSTGAGGGYLGSVPAVLPTVKMSRYNFVGNPCFLGSCMVKMVDDGASTNGKRDRELKVQDLRAGMYVLNLLTGEARKIVAVVQTPSQPGSRQQICRIGDGLWITPYHPIFHRPSQKWVFPIDVADEVRELDDYESVYSILLTPAKFASSHAIEIGGVSCVTLGHGLTDTDTDSTSVAQDTADVRTHSFFGDYEAVSKNLACLPQDSEGMHLCAGVSRDEETGLINGFIPDLNLSTASTVIEHTAEVAADVPLTAAKQVFDFSTTGIDVGHCSPMTMSFPSSPSPCSPINHTADDRVWWQPNSAVGVAA